MARYFRYPKQGTFVDIGCNHPVENNNTYLFYRLGWRGLCIDANPVFAPLYAELRPEDKFLNCGVGATASSLTFYRFEQAHPVSTFSKAHADFWAEATGGASQYQTETVQVKNINEILTEADIAEVDVLSVDIEMLDAEVILSFDFNRWRPRVIAIEDHAINMADPQASPIFQHLSAIGYMFDSKTVDTSIYVWPLTPFQKNHETQYRAAIQARK